MLRCQREENKMIHKVYIVRCSYCHGSVRDCINTQLGVDFRPRYFYNMKEIQPAIEQAGWRIINGTEVCAKCLETYTRSEL